MYFGATDVRIGMGLFCVLACVLFVVLDAVLFVKAVTALARKKNLLSFAFLGLACSAGFFAVGTIWSLATMLVSVIRFSTGYFIITFAFTVAQSLHVCGLLKFNRSQPPSTLILLWTSFASPIFIAILFIVLIYIKEIMLYM